MSSSNGTAATVPASSASTAPSASPSVASASGRPMTWAERLAGKASSSTSSLASSNTPQSNSRTMNGHPASTAVSASSSSQADSVSAPGNSSSQSPSSMPSARKKTRSPSNAQIHVDSQSSKSASATSPITGKSKIPTSADSGWGEADSNVGSPQAGPSRTRAQSSNPSNQTNPGAANLPSNSNAEKPGTSAIASNPDSSVTSSSQPSAPSEQPKESSGPPKVNIWQVRREEAAKKAAEQEKLKKEQEALQKHQQSTDVAQTKQKNEDSAASSPTASKGGKKKRDSANPQNASTPASTPAPGNKGKESNRKASGNKPTSKVSSSTSRQVSQQSVNAAKAGSGTEQAVVNTASASDWPSPSEEKDREAAESQKKPQSVRGNEDTAPSNQASVEAGTSSPSRSKKQTWKTIQPEITFNTPLPSRKSSDASKTGGTTTSRTSKQPSGKSEGSAASSSKDMSRSSSKVSNKEAGAITTSDKPAAVQKQATSTSSSAQTAKAQSDSNPDAPAMATEPMKAAPKADKANQAEGSTPSLPSGSDIPKQTTSTPTMTVTSLPSSLPAKPIGAPTESGLRPRLSPSMHGHPSSSSNASLRSRQSPAAMSNTPATIDTPPSSTAGNMPYQAYDNSRSPLMGQQMLPPQYGMMIPPGGPGGFHPSIAPMQQYPNQQGGAGRNNNKRGALNANTNRAGRGGRVSSLNPRNQSPNNQSPYGSGITSPIMGNQQLYQPTGYPAPLPPNFYYDPNQAQASQYNPQFEPTSAGAFNNGMPTYYPAPMMYPPTLGPDGNYYPGSPAQQAAMLPPQTRQPQQVPPPPRSVAHSEASQPDSPMPQPAMQGGAPIFQPTTAGYPMSMPMPNGAIPMPFTSPYPQNAAMPFSPPQMPPQHIQPPPQSTSGQVQQGQATSGTTQTLPTYARPSPLYDYSFIVFPPDGTAFWVLGQIEFYFSADNLVRDLFLRQSMDEEGWVDIGLIASFRRLNSLTQDIHLIRSMMETSFMTEVREMKVRSRDWRQWVLPGARKVSWQYPDQLPPPPPASSSQGQGVPFGMQMQIPPPPPQQGIYQQGPPPPLQHQNTQ